MHLGSVNNLAIRYFTTIHEKWAEQLSDSGWILLAIADVAAQTPEAATVACLRRAPAGIGCSGRWAAALENSFDMEIALQALDWEEQHQLPFDYTHAPVTTANLDTTEALWFAVTLASNIAKEVIDTVVCLDFTRQQETCI